MAGFLVALNAVATSATVSLAFAGYLNVFVQVPAQLTGLALLAGCTVLNIIGIRQATWVSIGLILVEVGGLLVLIAAGLIGGKPGSAIALPSIGDAGGIFAATALVFFVYIGFEDVANLAEEAKHPRLDVPRALLASVVITTLLYLLVVWAVLALMTPQALAESDAPLTTAAVTVAPLLGQLLAITALFATASTALISLVSISRMLFGMARDGNMPRALSLTLIKRRTPWVAALVLFAGACALLPLGKVKIIASISALGILIVFVGVHTAMIVLRWKLPQQQRPFRVPVQIGRVPVLPAAGLAICMALITQFEALVYGVTAGALALA